MIISIICRSGSEEDFSELNQLLEDINVYMRDFAVVQVDKKCDARRKEEYRKRGEEMRQAAMMSMVYSMVC